jgi:para-nitrobenzyl esterase
MLTAWTNFAKYSDPNGDANSKDKGLGWEQCTAEKPLFMLFKLDSKDAEASEMGEPILPE